MRKKLFMAAVISISSFAGNGFAAEVKNEEIKPIENLFSFDLMIEEADEATVAAWEAYREYMMDILDVVRLRNSVIQQAQDPDLANNGWLYRSRQNQILGFILADYGIMADTIYKWTSDSRNMKIRKHAIDLYREIYNTIQMLKRKDALSNNNVLARLGAFSKKIDMLTSKHIYNIQDDMKEFSEKGIDTAPFISTLQIISKNI